MPPSLNSLGSLSQSAQLQKLKSAKGIMWAVGILTIVVQIFMFVRAETEYDEALAAELRKVGTSLSAIPAELRAEVDKERTDIIAKLHLIYGAGIGLGAIFIGCALMVNRKPVIATMTALVLYLGSIAAMAALDGASLAKGIIIKALIVGGLIGAVKAAIAYEREQRQQA